MPTITGPARYLFLRRASGAEDVPHWPPQVKPYQWPENHICTAARLDLERAGWRLETVDDNTILAEGAPGGFWLSRETVFGLEPEPRRNPPTFELLGVRVVRPVDKGPEYASHLVVRLRSGGGWGMPKEAIVVPIDALVLAGYVETQDTAEAAFNLRLTRAALGAMPPYLTDAAIMTLAQQALDRAAPNPRARHDMLLEVEAGRVALLGRTELTSTGDAVRAELETTPGVIEVVDHLIYDEDLVQTVSDALTAKGLGAINVLVEHNLVILQGTVPDRATLYKAKDIALRIPGVRGVVTNELLVEPGASAGTQTTSAASGAATASAQPQQQLAPQSPAKSEQADLATSR
jgi:osmotically-inducible protein OsmY